MADREKRDRVQGIPIWQRKRDGIWRADFRRFEGGGRESLGTADRTEAEEALAERKRELEEEGQRMKARQGGNPYLEDFCQTHLDKIHGEIADSTYANHERALGYLLAYLKRRLPQKPKLSDVTARRLSDFKDKRLKSVKASTVRTEFSGISSMLRRAVDWELVPRNEAHHVRMPKIDHDGADFLETGEAAKVLQAAKAMEDDSASRCYTALHALLATFLLTGGRRMEVFGLERQDVNLKAGTVRFEPNEWRNLKTSKSKRTVPLWPQLRSVLTPYMEAREDDNPLLFPSRTGGPLNDLRSALDTVETKAKLEKRLTPKIFRHTYTATRIQTLEGGAPVSLYTVARELGHKGTSRIEDTYGHLQERRSRLSEVRYQVADVVALEEKRGA